MREWWGLFCLSCRFGVSLLLLVSAVAKLMEFGHFKKALLAHGLLPPAIASWISVCIPVLEFLIGCGLPIRAFTPVSEIMACGLFTSFGLFIAVSLLRGKNDTPCGCFGSRSGRISWRLVSRNLTLAGLSLLSTGKVFVASNLFAVLLLLMLLACLRGTGKDARIQPSLNNN